MKLLSKVLFYVLWMFVKLFGLLPTKIHYLFADLIFYVLRYVFRYRLSVVTDNLEKSFPEKSKEEIANITTEYYRYLGDVFVETFLLSSLSAKELKRRMIFEDFDEMERLCEENSQVFVASAHYCSWEYSSVYSNYSKHNIFGVYHPLSNQVMESYYFAARSRFGATPLPMSKVAKQIVTNIKEDKKSLYLLIGDQTPPKAVIKRWMIFLGRPTAFYDGMEKLALKYKKPIIFLNMERVKRGYYRSTIEMIYDGKEQVEPYEITKRYVALLERMIRREPSLWLWSHRRWKHQPTSEEQIVR